MSTRSPPSPPSHPCTAEYLGAVIGYMPITYWDAYFKSLLFHLSALDPAGAECRNINRALGDMQLMACGDAAERSLAAWRKVAAKRGDLGSKRERSSSRRGVWKAVKRIFDF